MDDNFFNLLDRLEEKYLAIHRAELIAEILKPTIFDKIIDQINGRNKWK